MALCYFALFFVLTQYAHVWYPYAIGVTYIVIFVLNILLLKRVFHGQGEITRGEFTRYAGIALLNFVLNELFSHILIGRAGMNHFIAQVIIVGGLFIMNFFLYKFFLFPKPRTSS